MKWLFTQRRKMRAALILGVVFVFIFAKNWLDKKNVSELGSSFASVYEDRLLAESYIYKLSDHLYQKKIILDKDISLGDKSLITKINPHNAAIKSIMEAYEKTRLTKSESAFFQDFKKNIAQINALEVDYMHSGKLDQNASDSKLLMHKHYELATGNLHQLSEIQVSEGKILNEKSQQIIAGSNLLKDFEFALLLGLALMMYSLILTTKSVLSKIPHKPSLN